MNKRKYYEAYDERYKKAHEEGLRWFGGVSSPIVSEVVAIYLTIQQVSQPNRTI